MAFSLRDMLAVRRSTLALGLATALSPTLGLPDQHAGWPGIFGIRPAMAQAPAAEPDAAPRPDTPASKPAASKPAASKPVASKPAASRPLVIAPAGASASKPAATRTTTKSAGIPLPPPRPASLGGSRTDPVQASGASSTPASDVPAANLSARATPAAGASSTEPLSERAGVDLLNGYFNSFSSMVSDFIQVGADGRRYEGKLYIQRPGRMRFEYNAPATIEIIADGTSVAIRDRKLATQDLYTIGQTPLKFLLKEKIDLARDTTVKRVSTARDGLSVEIEDKATLGGTSKITLQYDRTANVLRQWVIVDPQGYETSVAIFNVETQKRIDPRLFAINYQRVLEDRK